MMIVFYGMIVFFMGMYDYVKIDAGLLPVSKKMEYLSEFDFQTKSFDNEMTTYHIKKDGIYKLKFDSVMVPKAERPYPDAEEGSLMSFCGCITRINEKWVKLGDVEPFQFYNQTSDGWMEFECSFIHDEILIIDISVEARKENKLLSEALAKAFED